jgi:hypothetical protein
MTEVCSVVQGLQEEEYPVTSCLWRMPEGIPDPEAIMGSRGHAAFLQVHRSRIFSTVFTRDLQSSLS